jgi:hypothetical protein
MAHVREQRETTRESHGLKKVPLIAMCNWGPRTRRSKDCNRGSLRMISGNIAGKPGTLV